MKNNAAKSDCVGVQPMRRRAVAIPSATATQCHERHDSSGHDCVTDQPTQFSNDKERQGRVVVDKETALRRIGRTGRHRQLREICVPSLIGIERHLQTDHRNDMHKSQQATDSERRCDKPKTERSCRRPHRRTQFRSRNDVVEGEEASDMAQAQHRRDAREWAVAVDHNGLVVVALKEQKIRKDACECPRPHPCVRRPDRSVHRCRAAILAALSRRHIEPLAARHG